MNDEKKRRLNDEEAAKASGGAATNIIKVTDSNGGEWEKPDAVPTDGKGAATVGNNRDLASGFWHVVVVQ